MVLDGHEPTVHPHGTVEEDTVVMDFGAAIDTSTVVEVKKYRSEAHAEADRPYEIVHTDHDGTVHVEEFDDGIN